MNQSPALCYPAISASAAVLNAARFPSFIRPTFGQRGSWDMRFRRLPITSATTRPGPLVSSGRVVISLSNANPEAACSARLPMSSPASGASMSCLTLPRV